MQYNYLHAMKKFYKNSKPYVLLGLLSMSLILQSCNIEKNNQDSVPSAKSMTKRSKQAILEIDRSSRRLQKGLTFIGKREREKERQETRLVQTQNKRRKIERSRDENAPFEDVEEITATEGCGYQDESVGQQRRNTSSPMNLVTFFKAISESNKARRKAQKQGKEEENRRGNEVLKNIFQHLPFFSILNLTSANSNLYKFINQWDEIGATGLDIVVPETSRILNNLYKVDQFYTHFEKIPYTPKTIPSIVFYRIIQRASKLPKEYWPYLPNTSITEISLIAEDLTDEDFLTICDYLVDSKIKKIYLGYNNITDRGMDEIIKAKKNLRKIQINLKGNNISEEVQKRITDTYPDVTWKF